MGNGFYVTIFLKTFGEMDNKGSWGSCLNEVHQKFPLDMCPICLKFSCSNMLLFGLVFVLF